jgi:CHAT domain-containing protein
VQSHDVQEEIRHSSPAYAELTQPRPLTVAEIQRLLDPRTMLLEYSLGARRSYLWAISHSSLSSYRLPSQSRIDPLARKLYQLLSARSHGQSAQAADVQRIAARLSAMLLGPVAAKLKGKRLLVVAEGTLQYIPLAALPAPGSASAQPGEPLIVEHEIVNLPSASVLATLRRTASQQKSNPKAVAVLADPVFDRDDARVRPLNAGLTPRQPSSVNALRAPPVAWIPHSPDDTNGDRLFLPRLPFSRREALSILKVTAPGQAMGALDFDASVATASSSELGQYRIVHFATHGLVNSARPELSGLVFSLVDQNGNPQDGFLALGAIYDLDLPVELVVLSACSTALGKDVEGEGLLGMTRGFMYAGSPRVIASLWNVNDVSTAELMAKFYAGTEQKHLRPAAALRAAQIAMWKQKRWRAPYYWAAFLFQGEWE